MKLLADHERGEYQYVDGSCVLKEDRICSRGLFRRPNEQEQQQTIDQSCDDAESVYLQAVLSRDDQDRDGCKEGTEERYLICIKRCQLDEETAGAPEEHGDQHEDDRGNVFLFGKISHEFHELHEWKRIIQFVQFV